MAEQKNSTLIGCGGMLALFLILVAGFWAWDSIHGTAKYTAKPTSTTVSEAGTVMVLFDVTNTGDGPGAPTCVADVMASDGSDIGTDGTPVKELAAGATASVGVEVTPTGSVAYLDPKQTTISCK